MPDDPRFPPEKLPRHIAFIMDGNGRWASARGLQRLLGHESGAESLRRITRFCRSIGISQITFYALSTENYLRRPRTEVGFLLRLLKNYLVGEREELLENGIRLTHIGRVETFPADVLTALLETERLTRDGRGMVMRLALNYGSRQELAEAVAAIALDAAEGKITPAQARAIGEADIQRYLQDPSMPDPDLVIRTAGEYRLSNFLLWQASYSEIWVTKALWPDFDVEDLEAALRDYSSRERKYGALGAPQADSRRLGSDAARLPAGGAD
ncbi:MAG TPA: polyprenyl diphosphate synthase [Planctomycetota bacterium]|nr:polyprenyl diphosphate synthase [Planctomycetota bacterium]